MTPARTLVLAAVTLGALTQVARAETVVLKDGRKLVGTLVEEKDVVVVKQRLGEIRVTRDQIVRIEADDAFAVLARKKRELGQGTADDRYRLGVFCRDQGFKEDARAAFESALQVDRDHAPTRTALGFAREDGRWVAEADRMRAKGLVPLGDKWVTPTERALADTMAKQRQEEAREKARKAEEERDKARKAKVEAERAARDARIRAYDEELARARARRQAEEEAEPQGLSIYRGFAGPYGPWAGYYGRRYGWATLPSSNDLLTYYAVKSGRYPYPTLARPTPGGVVLLQGPSPCWPGRTTYGPWGWGGGIGFQGQWTSGRSSFRLQIGLGR